MSLRSELRSTTAGRIKARGLKSRALTFEQRVKMAADACSGRLDVCNFSTVQSAQLFTVLPSYIETELKARRAPTNGNGTISKTTVSVVDEDGDGRAVAEAVAEFVSLSPQEQRAFIRALAGGMNANSTNFNVINK